MSEAEQDAVILKLVKERAELEKVIALLRWELRTAGEAFQKLGAGLVSEPEYLQLLGVATEGRYKRTYFPLDPAALDLNRAIAQLQELREKLARLEDVEAVLAKSHV